MPLPPPHESDDGNPAERWEDTAMKQDFDKILTSWNKWQHDYKNEFPSNEFDSFVTIADTVLEQICNYMKGRL